MPSSPATPGASDRPLVRPLRVRDVRGELARKRDALTSSPSSNPSLSLPQAWLESSVKKLDLSGAPITIDDLASRSASAKGPAVVTSPRSVRACLEAGVDPASLAPRPVSAFADPSLNAEQQRFKWEHYELARRERVASLNAARALLPFAEEIDDVPGVRILSPNRSAAAAARASTSTRARTPDRNQNRPRSASVSAAGKRPSTVVHRSPGAGKTLPVNASFDHAGYSHVAFDLLAGDAAALREERARMEAAARREEKRVAAIAAQKAIAEALQAEQDMRLREHEALMEEHEMNKRERLKDRQRREFERVKARKEEKELLLKLQKLEADAEFKRVREEKKQREENERARKREATRIERERVKNELDFKMQTERIKSRQLDAVERKKRELERAAREKEAAIERARAERAAEKERRSSAHAEKCELAKSRAEVVVEARREEILSKAEEVERRQAHRAEHLEYERARKAAENAAKAAFKHEVYEEVQAAMQAQRYALLEEKERELERKREEAERKKKEREMAALAHQLEEEERKEKVERMRRKREYESAQRLEKIERETARARAIQDAKEQLRLNRRHQNEKIALQRESLVNELDVRTLRNRARMSSSGTLPRSASRPGSAGTTRSSPAPPRSALVKRPASAQSARVRA